MTTKKERLQKIVNPSTGRTVIIPMDHGATDGPVPGIVDMPYTLAQLKEGGVDAVVLHKGVFKHYRDILGEIPVIVHLSVSTSMGGAELQKVLVGTVEEAMNLGAAGVSVHVNVGNQYEKDMIQDLGMISGECERLGMPLLAMMYPRNETGNLYTERNIAQAARLAFEMGADIVKVPYTGSPESFASVVAGCPIPVVIAGGDKSSDEAFLQSVKGCVEVGAAGISAGRNVFQHENVSEMVGKVREVVHGS